MQTTYRGPKLLVVSTVLLNSDAAVSCCWPSSILPWGVPSRGAAIVPFGLFSMRKVLLFALIAYTTGEAMSSGGMIFLWRRCYWLFVWRVYQHALVRWIFLFPQLRSRFRLGDRCWNGGWEIWYWDCRFILVILHDGIWDRRSTLAMIYTPKYIHVFWDCPFTLLGN